ncbi:MAG: periplasmic heavy metal sensor [Roseivirga sp.]|nr:periplasmic heavy metal sensor [Roseivirga sp.]
MKSNTLKSRVIGAVIMLMIATVSVQAQDRRQGPRQGGPGHEQVEKGERDGKKPGHPPIPNMTEEQQEQMKAIHLGIEKEALPIRNQIGEKEARLRTLVTAASYDERAVNKVLDEMGDLKASVKKLEIAGLQKAKEVLTEEQMLFLYKHMDKKTGPKEGRGPKGPRGGR